MDSDQDMDYESDADEVQEYETTALSSLRGKEFTVKNPDGTLRCPLSPSRKKQTYAYKDLLQHAVGVVNGRRDAKARGQHSALKKFLERDLVSLAAPPVERILKVDQEPPRRRDGDGNFVFPWSVVVYNIDNSRRDAEKGTQIGVGKSELREYFLPFKPKQLNVFWGPQGHLGMAVLHFEGDFSGLKDALALESYFLDQERGRRDYEKISRSGGRRKKEFYGWLATEDDVKGRFGFQGAEVAKYLKDYGNVTDIEVVGNNVKRMYDQQVRHLKVTVSEKEERNKKLVEGMEVLRRNSELHRQQQEDLHKKDLEHLRKQAENSEDKYNQASVNNEKELQRKEEELCMLYKELEAKKSTQESDAERTQLETQMAENQKLREKISQRQGMAAKNEAEMLNLLQRHEEEIEQLTAKAHNDVVQLIKRQKVEVEKHQLRNKIATESMMVETMKGLSVSEEPEQKIKGRERLEQELKESLEQLKDLEEDQRHSHETMNALISKEKVATDELAHAGDMSVKILKYLAKEENKAIVENALSQFKAKKIDIQVKSVGSINGGPWAPAWKRKGLTDEAGLKKLSWWEGHIRKSTYHPFKMVETPGSDKVERILDVNDKFLSSLRASLGEEVYKTVAVALEEIEEYNPSGRYPVPKPWNFTLQEPRKATVGEVIEQLEAVIKGLVRLSNPTRKKSRV